MAFYDGVPVPVSVRIARSDWEALSGLAYPEGAEAVSSRARKLCALAVMAFEGGSTWVMEQAVSAALSERGKRNAEGKRIERVRLTVRLTSGAMDFLEDFRYRYGISVSSLIRNIVSVSVPLVPEDGWERDDEHP